MRMSKTLILLLLVLSMLLSACGAAPADEAEQTAPATEAVEPEAVVEETEPAIEKPAFMEKLHYQPQLTDTVLPEKDVATGTMMFYLNDRAIHAGAPVSELLEECSYSDTDMSGVIEPWHMSGAIRIQVKTKDADPKDEPFVFFVAMNASDEPKMISECLIYSLTINYEKDMKFGTGKEKEPFVTGTTTVEEVLEAYGEPTYIDSLKDTSQELFYYEPFNCVSILCRKGVVKQVNAYYSANVYGALAENLSFELTGNPMENDALILMSQYMDITPYLPEKEVEVEETEEEAKKEEKTEEKKVKEKKISLASFDESFQLDGNTIKFGSTVSELPEPFKAAVNDLKMPISKNHYVRTGRHEPEEFFLLNANGQIEMMSDNLVIKGVVVENKNYNNWGFDNSAFHSFNCQGVTEESTIDEVLALLGQPGELDCFSGERNCFVWMHYETEAGDYLHVRVDPLLNQVIEVNMVKYFKGERSY